jgi:hypothetical protein
VYDFGLGIGYDAIVLFDSMKGGNWNDDMYKFEIKADTLKLYKIKTDWDNLEHEVGDITYILIKQ